MITDLPPPIIHTQDFAVIEQVVKESDLKDLIVFDVDEVLLMARDQLLQHKSYANEKLNTVAEQVGLTEFWNLMSIVFMERKAKHVDPKFAPLIENLQSQNIKTLALTHCQTDGFGRIASMKDWRLNELKSLGYHFERSWPAAEEKVFEDLRLAPGEVPPLFAQGVLFTNNVPKGLVLKAFLADQKLTPRRIVFIDDRLAYLESVQSICQEASIPFFGIHYTKAEEIAKDIPATCEKRAPLQMEVLMKEKRWLSDEEADAILKHEAS